MAASNQALADRNKSKDKVIITIAA